MIPLKINKPYIVLLPHQFMLLETTLLIGKGN